MTFFKRPLPVVISLAVLATALTVSLAACNGAGGGVNPNEKVATVNGAVVTRADYDKVYEKLSKGLKLEAMADSPQKQMMDQMLKMQTLNQLIANTLMKQDAKEMSIEVKKEDVDQFKAKNFASEQGKKQLEDYLNEQMMSPAEFDEMIKDELLMQRFAEKVSNGKALVTDAEAEKFYKQNPKEWKVPETIHASHILIKATDEELQNQIKAESPSLSQADVAIALQTKKGELKQKADKVFGEVRQQPAQFEELAKKYSEDPGSAKRGGDLGFMPQDMLIPQFWQAIKNTANGAMYPKVLETPFGFHVIKVHERKQPHTLSLVEAKPMITQHLSQQKMQQVMSGWLAQKQATSQITIEPAYQPTQPGQDPLGAAQQQGAAPAGQPAQ